MLPTPAGTREEPVPTTVMMLPVALTTSRMRLLYMSAMKTFPLLSTAVADGE